MGNEYLKIMFAQIEMQLGYNNEKEYLIENELYFKQINEIIENFASKNPDILILPEMSYNEKYEEYFLNNSSNKLIVFGSMYENNHNYTVVYHNNKKFLINKYFNSGVEPAIRFQNVITENEFIKNYLKEHTFKINNKKIIILNCAEYYKVAYLISKNRNICKNLFGFLVPCANNNNEVFLTEAMAIHNHNENIYSFIINSISTYNEKPYSNGESFVFGKISSYEKEFLPTNLTTKHCSNICKLNSEKYIVYGEYLHTKSSSYYRSDDFKHTPKNLKFIKIGETKWKKY